MDSDVKCAAFIDVKVAPQKEAALATTAELLANQWSIDGKELYASFVNREAESSTGFGDGIAIPHAKVSGLEAPVLRILTYADPVEWAAIDEQPVSLAIALIVPTNADQVHLRLLSKLARKLVDHDYAERLRWSAHDAAQLTKQVQQALAE